MRARTGPAWRFAHPGHGIEFRRKAPGLRPAVAQSFRAIQSRGGSMSMQRLLPAALAAAYALAAGPAQAEMRNQWVEYSHGDTKLKAYMAYDDKVTGQRPAVLVLHA